MTINVTEASYRKRRHWSWQPIIRLTLIILDLGLPDKVVIQF